MTTFDCGTCMNKFMYDIISLILVDSFITTCKGYFLGVQEGWTAVFSCLPTYNACCVGFKVMQAEVSLLHVDTAMAFDMFCSVPLFRYLS